MYAINLVSTRTQQEDIKLTKQAIWVYENGTAFAAISVDNVGGRDVVLDKVQVRGVESSWSTIYYLRLSGAISTSLNCPNETHSWTGFLYTTGATGDFVAESTDLPLASGDTAVLYNTSPDSISVSDIGTTVGITVYTQNAQYYVECNVRSAETA